MPQILPPEAEGIVIVKSDMGNLKSKVKLILEARVFASENANINISMSDVIKKLSPKFEVFAGLQNSLECDNAAFIRLSKMQYDAFSMLQNFDRLNVRSCAGSGKTIIAMNLAKDLAASGKTVLLLCYNKLLAKLLNKSVSNPNIEACAFFDYCAKVARIPDDEIEKYENDPRLYSYALPKLLVKAVQTDCIYYDAVIVDEGQDFSESAWEAISTLTLDSGKFFVFYDEDQNIYQSTLNIPKSPYPEIVLTRNHRNSRKVFEYIKRHISLDGITLDDNVPEGQDIREFTYRTKSESFEILTSVVSDLKREKVNFSDVVIIGGHSMGNTCIGDNREICGIKVSESDETSGVIIRYRTYMKFKGCEAKVVIALDVDATDKRWINSKARYTAYSRAKSLLVVISKIDAM